jgi:hypothetical protein
MEKPVMLEQRIATAFSEPTSSAALTELIAEVEAAAVAASEAAGRARERALDPMISDVEEARRASADATFNAARMKAAVERLRERQLETIDAEREERRVAAYEAAKAERDEIVCELKTFYPAAAKRLAKLAARIVANNKAITKANVDLPKEAEWLACAEMQARGISSGFTTLGAPPRLIHGLKLPSFGLDHSNVWPPRG